MAEIELANQRGTVLVDDDVFEWVSQYSWGISPQGYAQSGRHKQGEGHFLMHRLINGLPRGARTWDGQMLQVHHINHERLDNRVGNLIVVTCREHNRLERDWRKALAA